MLTFDEFFKKKRIDLAALQKAEPGLFSEFKTHFEQMGEKSFDHTKKYWFNKTRRQFPLAVEAKTEKVHIVNPLAEQTITESLTETEMPAASPKVGFTPRFKAGAMGKPTAPTENKPKETAVPAKTNALGETPAETTAKVGFTPRFKMKPKVEETTEEAKPVGPTDEKPILEEEIKPVYKPRFNRKNIPPKE